MTETRTWVAWTTEVDTQNLTGHDTRVVIPIVIGIIALVLLIYLRSVVATVYLIATDSRACGVLAEHIPVCAEWAPQAR